MRPTTIALALSLTLSGGGLVGCHSSASLTPDGATDGAAEAAPDRPADGPPSLPTDAPADETAGGGEVGTLTADAYCLSYQSILFDLFARCFGTSRVWASTAFVGQCAAFADSVVAGKISFDSARAAACLEVLPSYYTCPGEPPPAFPVACNDIAAGLVPLGGACSNATFVPSDECQGRSYCFTGADACAGPSGTCTAFLPRGATCDPTDGAGACDELTDVCDATAKKCIEAPTPPKAGQACAQASSPNCAAGTYCDDAGVCRATLLKGAACTRSYQCGQGATCAGASGATKCSAYRDVGETCVAGQQVCAGSTYCGAGGKCALGGVAVGAPCGFIGGEGIPCADGAYCDADAVTGAPGVCHPKKAVGEACTEPPFQQCGGRQGSCDPATHKCVACPS
jgi:hypothetical protein